jgi:hypothetical protein
VNRLHHGKGTVRFQATGVLSTGAEEYLSILPPLSEIQDEKVRTCVSISGTSGALYNRTLVAIAYALRHAKNKREVEGFIGLWSGKGSHRPYNSNIRKLLLGTIWKRISADRDDITLTDLKRSILWLRHRPSLPALAPRPSHSDIDYSENWADTKFI